MSLEVLQSALAGALTNVAETSNKLHSLTHSLLLTHHNDTGLVVGQHD